MTRPIINLHDKAAARIARREIPSLVEAHEIRNEFLREKITELAERVFRDAESLTDEEVLVLLADRRIQLDQSEPA